LQEELNQLRRYEGVCIQLHRFVDEREDKKPDVLYLFAGRRNLIFHIPFPVSLHGDDFSSKLPFN
jgi:hypothetical protein